MPGVYASGETTDDYGVNWKVDIYDTTYGSGIIYPFTFASNAFTRTYEGITDKPLFTPAYKSRVTAKMLITENDGPIEALITDIANGKEDQFYMLVYKDTGSGYALWFAGMILCDLCQYDDLQRFAFEITATDGFNRLENFDFPIDEAEALATNGFVSELEVILIALQICGIERFYGAADHYIGIAVNWHEVNQVKSLNSLTETRVAIDSFIEDWDTMRPKRALEVIENIIQSYGAQIRFEGGMWRITQLETQNGSTIDYEYFNKTGGVEATGTEANEVVIDTSGNKTNDIIVNMFLPALYGVGGTAVAESKHQWGLNEEIITPATLDETMDVDTAVAYRVKVDIGYIPQSSAMTPTTRVYFRVERNGYTLVRNITGSGRAFWILTGSFNPAIQDRIYREFVEDDLFFIRREFSFAVNPPPGAGPGQTLFIRTWVGNTTTGANQDFISYSHQISQTINGEAEQDLSYVATNSIYNAASVWLEEELTYCDTDRAFVYGRRQINNGSSWVPSEEWASGTVATSGVPFIELLCSKAVYFQRFPRALIQGSLVLPDYQSICTVYWRSRRFIMLNGSFDAKAARWTGVWMELLEQDSDVVSAPRNPYRDQFVNAKRDIRELEFNLAQTSGELSERTADIFMLQKVNTIASTTDRTIIPEETSITFTNEGATGVIRFTLPSWANGLRFRFANDGVNELQVDPNGGDGSSIYLGGTAGNLLSSTSVTSLEIAATATSQWVVIAIDRESSWTLT